MHPNLLHDNMECVACSEIESRNFVERIDSVMRVIIVLIAQVLYSLSLGQAKQLVVSYHNKSISKAKSNAFAFKAWMGVTLLAGFVQHVLHSTLKIACCGPSPTL